MHHVDQISFFLARRYLLANRFVVFLCVLTLGKNRDILAFNVSLHRCLCFLGFV